MMSVCIGGDGEMVSARVCIGGDGERDDGRRGEVMAAKPAEEEESGEGSAP